MVFLCLPFSFSQTKKNIFHKKREEKKINREETQKEKEAFIIMPFPGHKIQRHVQNYNSVYISLNWP